MATSTDNDRELLTVIASFRARPGKEQELRAALEALVEPSSRDAGCVDYDLHQGVEDPAVFSFYENWTDVAAHDAHNGAPHIAAFRAVVGDLVDGDVRVDRLRRIA